MDNSRDMTPPENPESLKQVRDRLRDYLAALDAGEKNAREWLIAHEMVVTIGYHWLDRAINLKMQKEAAQILASLGQAAGFVLTMQDFKSSAEKTFGANGKLAQEIAKHKLGLPDDVTAPVATPPLPQIPDSILLPPPPAPRANKKKWWSPASWFEKEKAPDTSAAERAARQTEWQALRDDITAMQSDRHYYVDSFMDWVGDTLAPEGAATPDNMMDSYKDPQRIADLAAADQKKNIARHAEKTGERVRLYARLAATLDEQRIDEFKTIMVALFPKKDTDIARHLREMFLEDYRVASFTELVMKQGIRREDRLELFRQALALEPGIAFKGLHGREEILSHIRRETNDREFVRLARNKFDENEYAERAKRRNIPPPEEEISLTDLFKRALDGLEKILDRAANAKPPPPKRKW